MRTLRVAIIAGAGLYDRVSALLRAWGCEVTVMGPDGPPCQLAGPAAVGRAAVAREDVVVLAADAPWAVSLAGAYHAGATPVVNSYPRVLACRDAAVATRTLQLAGLPVPEAWLTTRPADVVGRLREGRAVVRSWDGSGGWTGGSVWSAADPMDAPGPYPNLVQRWCPPDGPSERVRSIAGVVFGAASPCLRDLALAAGAALGLDVFAVEVVSSDGRPYIVDVSAFPALDDVPDAEIRLAEHVYSLALAGVRDVTAVGDAR